MHVFTCTNLIVVTNKRKSCNLLFVFSESWCFCHSAGRYLPLPWGSVARSFWWWLRCPARGGKAISLAGALTNRLAAGPTYSPAAAQINPCRPWRFVPRRPCVGCQCPRYEPLTRRSRNQRGLNKILTSQRNRLLLISIHFIRTTAISLPTPLRGREIACSKTKRFRCCCRAGQSCRQIKDDLAPSLKRP